MFNDLIVCGKGYSCLRLNDDEIRHVWNFGGEVRNFRGGISNRLVCYHFVIFLVRILRLLRLLIIVGSFFGCNYRIFIGLNGNQYFYQTKVENY